MEYLTAFDINGNKIGKIERNHAHTENPGAYHQAVWIWIINSRGEVLSHRRSKHKKQSPLKWGGSSAGHVEYGESAIETCIRETREELGITLSEDKFEFLFTFIYQKGWELAENYLVEVDIPIENIKFPPEEVEEFRWWSFEDFKKLVFSDDFVRLGDEKHFKHQLCDIIEKRISKNITFVNLADCPQHIETISKWFYEEWGRATGRTLEEVTYRTRHSMKKDEIPQTHLAFIGDELVGTFSLWNNDLVNRQDLWPWLACLYVKDEYRGKGIGTLLQNEGIKIARKLGYKKLYLITHHIGYYEKYGWEFLETAPLHGDHITRIYAYDLTS